MSVAIKESGTGAGRALCRLFDAGGGSLDVAVATTWQALALRGNAHCLVCGETFVRTDEGDAQCTACASRLE
jgi:hypothetical protein